MTKIKDMSKRQRKVLDACHNGWFMSGEYRAMIDGHERRFWADSQRLLFTEPRGLAAARQVCGGVSVITSQTGGGACGLLFLCRFSAWRTRPRSRCASRGPA